MDIFSLGIILYQLANNLKHPYEENPIKLIIKYSNYYEKDNLEIKFSEEIKKKFESLNELFKIIQKEKIIHRDLKLENLLIKYNKEKTDYIIKLILV